MFQSQLRFLLVKTGNLTEQGSRLLTQFVFRRRNFVFLSLIDYDVDLLWKFNGKEKHQSQVRPLHTFQIPQGKTGTLGSRMVAAIELVRDNDRSLTDQRSRVVPTVLRSVSVTRVPT